MSLEYVPDGPIVMGWRWVPGTEHVYRTTVRRTVAGVQTLRTEQWTYRVLSVDNTGLAVLEGRLTALGAGVVEQGESVPESALERARQEEARATVPVQLHLTMDGVLRACSDERIGASLPHRLLDLRLPQHPVEPGALWQDTGLAHHLAGLVPPEIAVAEQGQTQLHEFSQRTEPEAVLWSQGSLRIGDGMAGVSLQSTARFGLRSGVLTQRELTLDGRGLSATTTASPGLLVAALKRV